MNLEEESSAPDVSTSDQMETDSDGKDYVRTRKRQARHDHGTIVKKIRDATRSTDEEKNAERDKGIVKFKARRVLTPGSTRLQDKPGSHGMEDDPETASTSNSSNLDK
jgi:hypothetical protein